MAVGQFFRQDGTLQFDATVPPYCFHSSGTVTTISTTGSDPHWSGSSPSSALIPMAYDSDEIIAVYLPGYGYARYGNLSWNGNWYHIFHTSAPLNTTVAYYRFRSGLQFSGDMGAGLELFDTGGSRTFHSAMRPAVVAGLLSGVGNSISLPGGRAYASVVQTQAGYETSQWSGGRETVYGDKGQIIYRYWPGVSYSRLYGVNWANSTTASLVEVPFNDQQIQSTDVNQPADSTYYINPIENVMFLDVAGL